MKNKILLPLLAFVLTTMISCNKKENKFVGKWIFKSTLCDTVNIFNNDNGTFIKFKDKLFSCKVDKNILSFNATPNITNEFALVYDDTITYGGEKLYKDIIKYNVNLDGDWGVIQCERNEDDAEPISAVSITKDTITITIGSPIAISGILKKVNDSIKEIYFNYGMGTIYAQEHIIDPISDKINRKIAIGKIKIHNNDRIRFYWYGVKLNNNKVWLKDGLESFDPLFWNGRISVSSNDKIQSTVLKRYE